MSMKLAKVAFSLAGISVTDVVAAAAHSDETETHGLRSGIAGHWGRYLAKGGNGGGKPKDGGDSSGNTCAAVGSACCQGEKARGKTPYFCDTTYVSNLACMEGVCLPSEPRPPASLEPPQCVTSRCGEQVGTVLVYGCRSDAECKDLIDADGTAAVCDTCAPKTCQAIPTVPTCAIPADFDYDLHWPCCGTCGADTLSCETAPGEVYIY